MVETINDNIVEFLRDKPHMTLHLEQISEQFPSFWTWINAEGNLNDALAEFSNRHNSTKSNRLRQW